MARMLRLSHDELYEFVKLYDTLRDMDFELTENQTNVFDRVQSMESTTGDDITVNMDGGVGGSWKVNDDYGSKVDALVDSMEVSE